MIYILPSALDVLPEMQKPGVNITNLLIEKSDSFDLQFDLGRLADRALPRELSTFVREFPISYFVCKCFLSRCRLSQKNECLLISMFNQQLSHEKIEFHIIIMIGLLYFYWFWILLHLAGIRFMQKLAMVLNMILSSFISYFEWSHMTVTWQYSVYLDPGRAALWTWVHFVLPRCLFLCGGTQVSVSQGRTLLWCRQVCRHREPVSIFRHLWLYLMPELSCTKVSSF